MLVSASWAFSCLAINAKTQSYPPDKLYQAWVPQAHIQPCQGPRGPELTLEPPAPVLMSAESDTAEQLSTCSTMIIVPVINDRLRVPVAHGDSLGPGDLVHLGASPSPGFPLHTDSSLTWTRS